MKTKRFETAWDIHDDIHDGVVPNTICEAEDALADGNHSDAVQALHEVWRYGDAEFFDRWYQRLTDIVDALLAAPVGDKQEREELEDMKDSLLRCMYA